jgi:hypothetical protein
LEKTIRVIELYLKEVELWKKKNYKK